MTSRIVLIGAGSAMFGYCTLGEIFRSKVLEGSTIVLLDINEQALKRVEATTKEYIQHNNLNYKLIATTDRKEALQGADYCVISIEVGNRYDLWEQDWKIPMQYGIPQIYGENGGPGGIFHSLRIIPKILEICEDIQAICPDATVFNLSNPMSRICTTIHRKFPDLKVIGLCEGVLSLIETVPNILHIPFSNLKITAGGLNHFSILLTAHYRDTGKDAYPEILLKAPEYFRDKPQNNLVFEFIKLFKVLPALDDSHFGEYLPWAHDVVDHQGILDFYNWYKRTTLSPVRASELLEKGTKEQEGYRMIPIIEEMLTDKKTEEFGVNIPNKGYIKELPEFLCVEVPATVDKSGIMGVEMAPFPKGYAGLLRNQAAVHDLTAEAVITGSKELALQALLVDPVVNSVRKAEALLDTMLTIQAEYLGYLR
ncbi:MAG: alpha-glucosidase [Anaerolineales bacterium]|nr:alpha-glucosidase [Anaerolineales bacterium]